MRAFMAPRAVSTASPADSIHERRAWSCSRNEIVHAFAACRRALRQRRSLAEGREQIFDTPTGRSFSFLPRRGRKSEQRRRQPQQYLRCWGGGEGRGGVGGGAVTSMTRPGATVGPAMPSPCVNAGARTGKSEKFWWRDPTTCPQRIIAFQNISCFILHISRPAFRISLCDAPLRNQSEEETSVIVPYK